MKIILAFDSFKGSLTAEETVAAAREGVLALLPDAEVVALPLADGGEGTTAALARFWDAQWVECRVSDSLLRPVKVRYAVSKDGQTAIMEMAAAAGLTLLRDEERNPMKTTTCGVGEMILDAVARGCTRITIGVGGSATNDGGMGMLVALGVRFLDEKGEPLKPIGENLLRIEKIDWSGQKDLGGIEIDAVCDVQNPLFGPDGAAFVYAPQKGASAADIERLDKGLRNLASRCRPGDSPSEQLWSVEPETPGSGAAGGLGFGLLLLGAKLRRGIDVILDAARLDEHLRNADLVITGEGRIDRQTLNGKLPFGVLQRAQKQHVPTIVLAGKVEDEPLLLQSGFRSVLSINSPTLSLLETMSPDTARRNLRHAVALAVGAGCRKTKTFHNSP